MEGDGRGIATVINECQEISAPIPTAESVTGSVKVTIFPRTGWQRLLSVTTEKSAANIAPAFTGASLHQLPSPPSDFTGRETDLAILHSSLKEGGAGAIFGLLGMGGVGKTTLALKLAQELTALFPDAQIYLDLKGVEPRPLTAAQAMAHTIRSFEPEARLPESETELAALYRSFLYGKHVILLMDNAAGKEQVEVLIPPIGNLLLVTSRFHFSLPGILVRDLAEMSLEEASDLLLRISPRIGDEANKIANLCGRLPLALRLAGSALAERLSLSPIEYARRLQLGKEQFDAVEASLATSYNLLTEDRQRLWRLLAVFPESFDAQASAALWDLPPESAMDVLDELVRNSLVEWEEKVCATIYTLLQERLQKASLT